MQCTDRGAIHSCPPLYSSVADIAAICAVRMSHVVVHPIDSYRTTVALFSRRRATAIATHRAVTEALGYRLALPTLAIASASLIACSRSTIATLNPMPTHGVWIYGGFSQRGRLTIFFSLSMTAANVVSSGKA
jgi:hypothetical protein